MQVASLAESQNDWLRAMEAYGHVLEHNEDSVQALLQLSRISQMQARYHDAVEYLHRVLKVDPSSGEVYGALGHCYLTMSQRSESVPEVLDCLRNCYTAYNEAARQHGTYLDANLWYGIGLLYERFGALMRPGSMRHE